MQEQQQSDWCWDAVAVSINAFLDPQQPPTWTQDTLATQLLSSPLAAGPNCTDPNLACTVCNQPERLDTAMTITKNLAPNGYLQSCYLLYANLQNWINAHLPVCARIVWSSGGAHFIALDGYATSGSGQPLVHVQDPLPGVAPSYWDYDTLVNDYDGIGNWQDSYLVTP